MKPINEIINGRSRINKTWRHPGGFEFIIKTTARLGYLFLDAKC